LSQSTTLIYEHTFLQYRHSESHCKNLSKKKKSTQINPANNHFDTRNTNGGTHQTSDHNKGHLHSKHSIKEKQETKKVANQSTAENQRIYKVIDLGKL
jgi:hypothetical protein